MLTPLSSFKPEYFVLKKKYIPRISFGFRANNQVSIKWTNARLVQFMRIEAASVFLEEPFGEISFYCFEPVVFVMCTVVDSVI